MTEEGELRASSDKMMTMIERLGALEATKRTLEVGSERFVRSAEEVERLARIVFRWSQIQLQLAHESRREGPAPTTIEQAASRPLDRILADWREAQLRLESALPGSPQSMSAAEDVERLREEFRAAQEARR